MAARMHPEIDVRKKENEIVSNVEHETKFGCHLLIRLRKIKRYENGANI